jgi:hypothetical protein
MLAVTVLVIGLAPALPGQEPQAPAAPKVQISFTDDGRVTLLANKATVREVLAEWSRVGGSTFVDAERLPTDPLTLRYEARPEAEVIASVLGRAAGYVIGPRRIDSTAASQIEVVFVLATSNPTQGAFAPPAPQNFPPPQVPSRGAPDDEIAPVGPPPGPQPAGTSGVPITIIPVPTVPPPNTGRGGGGGGGGGR